MLFPARSDHLVLGQTGPFSFFPRCRVPLKVRAAHTYVVGITGQGKSKLLEHTLFQDITQGRGCGLLDPHSDLASDTLRYLATWYDKSYMDKPYLHHRKNLERIIYFDPSRTDFILPFNVLATPFGTYETAQNVVEAFRRTWPQSLAEAPQFSNITLAALITLIENNLSLVEMHRLLTDQDFREALLSNVSNSEVVAFFHDRYDRWGREAPLMRESTLNKVAAFTFNPQLRFILGGRENVLDFRRIMDEGKVLIVDLGRCDPETRRLLGSLIVTGLELAACRQGHRVRFYNAAGLVNELIQAQDEHQLPRFLATALRHRLIVLDELGFIPFSPAGAQLIFQFCSTLYERVSMIVTTNLRFADWTQVFGDERLTAALLDRLTHKAHILEFAGESYRFRKRIQREAQEENLT